MVETLEKGKPFARPNRKKRKKARKLIEQKVFWRNLRVRRVLSGDEDHVFSWGMGGMGGGGWGWGNYGVRRAQTGEGDRVVWVKLGVDVY